MAEASTNNTNIIPVPRNWQKIFNIGDNPNAEQDSFLKFEAFTPPTINYVRQIGVGDPPYTFKDMISKGGYKFFHPNNQISETINHKYGNDTSTFQTAMNFYNNKAKSVTNAIQQFITGSDHGTVYDAPFLWSSADRRRFTITLDLFAYDNLNDDIYSPIMFFRKFSYPDRTGSTGVKVLGNIVYPCVFKISGGAFERLSAISEYQYYTLMNLDVKYNEHTKFFKTGIPMSASLSLTFEEVINIYADMFQTIDPEIKITNTKAYIPSLEQAQKTDLNKFNKNTKNGKNKNEALPQEHKTEVLTIDKTNLHYQEIGNGDITGIVQNAGEKQDRYYEVKDINPDNTPLEQTSTSPSNLDTLERFAVQRTQVGQLVKNAIPVLKAEVTSAITNIIQKSAIYKTIDTILNTDPRHFLEVKAITKGSRNINNDIDRIPPVTAILRKSRG
jgi:hypothetical protein